jgi:hypothetical protein
MGPFPILSGANDYGPARCLQRADKFGKFVQKFSMRFAALHRPAYLSADLERSEMRQRFDIRRLARGTVRI